MFTVCVLLYGDHETLARRCLESVLSLPGPGSSVPHFVSGVRIAANAPGQKTREYLDCLLMGNRMAPLEHRHDITGFVSRTNLLKYPAMRRLLWDELLPPETPYVMWFDDDSFLRSLVDGAEWLGKVARAMESADMIGAIYRQGLEGNQSEWIKAQPWYTGKKVTRRRVVRFATGGWWCIRTELSRKHDWPPREMKHRGGDVMLGELCRQQELRLRGFNEGVAINAGPGGVECTAKTRGYNEAPIGSDFVVKEEEGALGGGSSAA